MGRVFFTLHLICDFCKFTFAIPSKCFDKKNNSNDNYKLSV